MAMDPDLMAFLGRQFEETRDHVDVVAEGLRDQIRAVAEAPRDPPSV